MPSSPANQRNAVSQGMALGLLICGRHALPFDKLRIDFAFTDAWRSWEHRGKFPQVVTDLAKGSDPVWVVTHADARKSVRVLHWERDRGTFHIRLHENDWSADDPTDLDYAAGAIAGDVPVVGWERLARDFLGHFDL